ncbi:branched-chain amino acid ABC transporter permease [Chelativorans sp. AA-79]|uniref:branched-chain amino acid ABC transporter permease n=1 Tax=Chelativorans sp. AA-79 TaxID=3028735 RepID=UPI0023F78F3D|nr:branched-chain amino acid ABC transporter permease [Chelativorans sp. AA-79]WEX11076.1 branched-chain amino acid ABC transporter permease [Chelativorans sp. AA-79]
MRLPRFTLVAVAVVVAGLFLPNLVGNAYYFYAGYVVLQYVVIATGWNILGGYAGYTNFGASAFFGAGAYTAAFLFKALSLPLAFQILGAAAVGMFLGIATGYLTLRIQGVYFAIATVALVIVLETLVHNTDYLGGASGMTHIAPPPPAWFGGQTQFVFWVMLVLAAGAVVLARWLELSWIGRGLRAIRASEPAAESCGVPTLRLKLLACALSGGVMAAAGAPYPTYTSYLDPVSAFSLLIGLNALAMPLIGGTRNWKGPVIGAVLLASVQQIATVTISSEFNILAVGIVLIAFVVAAPEGLLGLRLSRAAR